MGEFASLSAEDKSGFSSILRRVGRMDVVEAPPKSLALVVVDPRELERACFVRCMAMTYPDVDVVGLATLAEWQPLREGAALQQIVIVNIGSRDMSEDDLRGELASFIERSGIPVVVMGDSTSLQHMIAALDCGAVGYFPSSVGIDEIVQAARLTAMGGIFLPLRSIQAMRQEYVPAPAEQIRFDTEFTERQFAVIEALRRGKPNKVIAYELDVCESTVKVHIRNIMKKLKVTNRTEAAFKLNMMSPPI